MVDNDKTLHDLHSALAHDLLVRIESGEATAQELSVAAKFLKDNHIESVPKPDNDLGKLMERMPQFDDEAPATFN